MREHICPSCTGEAFIKHEDGIVYINCGCCGKSELTEEEYEFEKQNAHEVTGVDL